MRFHRLSKVERFQYGLLGISMETKPVTSIEEELTDRLNHSVPLCRGHFKYPQGLHIGMMVMTSCGKLRRWIPTRHVCDECERAPATYCFLCDI